MAVSLRKTEVEISVFDYSINFKAGVILHDDFSVTEILYDVFTDLHHKWKWLVLRWPPNFIVSREWF